MTTEENALVPLQERQVDFYGDQVLAVLVEVEGQEQVYVPLRPIAEYLGLDWSSQVKRIRRDVVMGEAVQGVVIMTTPRGTPGGGKQEMLCLPLKHLPGWLFGVTPSKVREELREKVIRYQRECFDVLWRAFQGESLAAGPGLAMLRQVAEMGRAITALAEQQMAYQMQTNTRLDRAAEVVRSLGGRVGGLERRLAAGPLTEEQAAEVAARVKALAEALAAHDPSKNHYQGVFAELYRRFGVSGYKSLRLEQYEAVLGFLDDWRQNQGSRGNPLWLPSSS